MLVHLVTKSLKIASVIGLDGLDIKQNRSDCQPNFDMTHLLYPMQLKGSS